MASTASSTNLAGTAESVAADPIQVSVDEKMSEDRDGTPEHLRKANKRSFDLMDERGSDSFFSKAPPLPSLFADLSLNPPARTFAFDVPCPCPLFAFTPQNALMEDDSPSFPRADTQTPTPPPSPNPSQQSSFRSFSEPFLSLGSGIPAQPVNLKRLKVHDLDSSPSAPNPTKRMKKRKTHHRHFRSPILVLHPMFTFQPRLRGPASAPTSPKFTSHLTLPPIGEVEDQLLPEPSHGLSELPSFPSTQSPQPIKPPTWWYSASSPPESVRPSRFQPSEHIFVGTGEGWQFDPFPAEIRPTRATSLPPFPSLDTLSLRKTRVRAFSCPNPSRTGIEELEMEVGPPPPVIFKENHQPPLRAHLLAMLKVRLAAEGTSEGQRLRFKKWAIWNAWMRRPAPPIVHFDDNEDSISTSSTSSGEDDHDDGAFDFDDDMIDIILDDDSSCDGDCKSTTTEITDPISERPGSPEPGNREDRDKSQMECPLDSSVCPDTKDLIPRFGKQTSPSDSTNMKTSDNQEEFKKELPTPPQSPPGSH